MRSDNSAKKRSTPSALAAFASFAERPSRYSLKQRIRLNNLENPIMPFMAWYIDNFIASLNVANNNNIQRKGFLAREEQRKTDAEKNIIVR